MSAFWIDYKGHEIFKGKALPGQTWQQTTWIGHPWLFKFETGGKENANPAEVHFVPYRVIQNTEKVSTLDQDGRTGIHRFAILSSSRHDNTNGASILNIVDPIFPYPSSEINTVEAAFEWSLRQMEREESSPRTLLKYLKNIVSKPEMSKYRQIRTANKIFWNEVWITSGRGVLHALGFVENGAYIECGPHDEALPSDRLGDFIKAISELERWMLMQEAGGGDDGQDHESSSQSPIIQPNGADGFGRAGYGHAGSLNF